MSTALTTLGNKLAERFDMGANGQEVIAVLKSTAFKGPATDAQLTALMIVAQQYGLNPFTKELYAFPDSNNGIVPVVGVDGWARIINENPHFDGMDFAMSSDGEECTCTIHRKDRSHPISVTEYFSECRRDNAKPWKTHPKRMLRHKAMIQCARLAFGYVGIYDQDEAERIVERDMGAAEVVASHSDLLDEWVEKASQASDKDALASIWADGVKVIRAANDMPAYNAFKDAVGVRGKELAEVAA